MLERVGNATRWYCMPAAEGPASCMKRRAAPWHHPKFLRRLDRRSPQPLIRTDLPVYRACCADSTRLRCPPATCPDRSRPAELGPRALPGGRRSRRVSCQHSCDAGRDSETRVLLADVQRVSVARACARVGSGAGRIPGAGSIALSAAGALDGVVASASSQRLPVSTARRRREQRGARRPAYGGVPRISCADWMWFERAHDVRRRQVALDTRRGPLCSATRDLAVSRRYKLWCRPICRRGSTRTASIARAGCHDARSPRLRHDGVSARAAAELGDQIVRFGPAGVADTTSCRLPPRPRHRGPMCRRRWCRWS